MIKTKIVSLIKELHKKKHAQLIAISYSINKQIVKNAKKNSQLLGLDLVLDDSIFDKFLIYAGTECRQAKEINSAFANKKVEIILCATGGSGAIRILPKMKFDLIKNNKKPIIGYSDNTSILNVISQRCNMITIHGPHQTTDWSTLTKIERKILVNCIESKDYSLNIPQKGILINPQGKETISGKTIGGCFRPLYDLMNTQFKINMKNKVLFLEFNQLEGSRIYTWLAIWEMNNLLKNIKAVVLGDFFECTEGKKYVKEFFKNKQIPLIDLKNFGHCKKNIAFPIGADCKIDFKKKKISFMFPTTTLKG